MFQVEAGHAGAPEIRSPPVMATGRGGFPVHSRFLCRRRQTALALHLLTHIVRHDDSPLRVRAIRGWFRLPVARQGPWRSPPPAATLAVLAALLPALILLLPLTLVDFARAGQVLLAGLLLITVAGGGCLPLGDPAGGGKGFLLPPPHIPVLILPCGTHLAGCQRPVHAQGRRLSDIAAQGEGFPEFGHPEPEHGPRRHAAHLLVVFLDKLRRLVPCLPDETRLLLLSCCWLCVHVKLLFHSIETTGCRRPDHPGITGS